MQNSRFLFFFFSQQFISPYSLLACKVSFEKLSIIFVPLYIRCFFLWLLPGFFLYLILYFEDDMPRYSVFNSILVLGTLVFSELSRSVVWCPTLIWGKFSVITFSHISSVPFSLPSTSSICYCCWSLRHVWLLQSHRL